MISEINYYFKLMTCIKIFEVNVVYFSYYYSIFLYVLYESSICIYQAEKVTKRKGKNKEKFNPSDDQLRVAICDIFKEVDFNTVRSLIIFESFFIPSYLQVEFIKLD